MDNTAIQTIIKYRTKTYQIISVICFIASGIFTAIGFDKMNNYVSSDSSYIKNHNAYVGGDAYNYIINGTYTTAFFVLAVGMLLMGCLLILIHVHANSQYEILQQNERIIRALEGQQANNVGAKNKPTDELPEL